MASDEGGTITALTADELMRWVETTATRWRELLRAHPEALAFPCDIRETSTVAGLLQHLVAVELRYAERLADVAETPYEAIGYGSVEEIYATHDRAMELLREQIARPEIDWEERIEFQTRSAGVMQASRRTVLVHALMHTVRHYAQLATVVRQNGVKPGWAMDYLFMGAERL